MSRSSIKQRYELTAWDRFKFPFMFLGCVLVAAIGVGMIFFGLADVLVQLFR